MLSVTYAECHLGRVSLRQRVIYKPFMLSVILLNVVLLSVILLSVGENLNVVRTEFTTLS
jgi:hypothetical protein